MSRTASERTLRVALAAGGTGGHTFPAQALAEALVERGHKAMFITDHRGRIANGAIAQQDIHRLSVLSPAGGMVARARSAISLIRAYGEARGLLRAVAPDAVVGFGGYPSAPTVFAASRLGLPLILHEQNAKLGKTNRWMSRQATAVATSFAGVTEGGSGDIVMTGNPVRRAVVLLRDSTYSQPAVDGPFNLLVIGGSQGARSLAEKVPAALERLDNGLRERLWVTLQCPRASLAEAQERLTKAGIAAEVAEFFDDIAGRIRSSHLVISRSGASSVCEMAVAGRPAIFVPYPHHSDQQQLHNARALTEAGGGWVMEESELSPKSLADLLSGLAKRPARLSQAAQAARECGLPDAADRLADLVERVAGFVPRNGHPIREAAQ
ncbi:MAG: undecaprenyldiphospho-muramoylpentapeptide beta-N-acetylglucosaminyltransferase [Pseudomonadota bacterium]